MDCFILGSVQIKELEQQTTMSETLHTQLTEVQLEVSRLHITIDGLKRQLTEEQASKTSEDGRFLKRIEEATSKTESLIKDNISLRMYVSRLETELSISRTASDDVAVARQRDSKLIESLKSKLESSINKCNELDDNICQLTQAHAQSSREKAQALAALELKVSDKNRRIVELEASLRITTQEIASSESNLNHEFSDLRSQLSSKGEELNRMFMKYKECEREKQLVT